MRAARIKGPPLWDPFKAVDRLPQPYRMVDKLLAEIIEAALEICVAKDKQKKVKIATHIDTVCGTCACMGACMGAYRARHDMAMSVPVLQLPYSQAGEFAAW